MNYKNRRNILFLVSCGLLFFVAWSLMVAAMGFFLGVAIGRWHWVIASILSVVSLVFFGKKIIVGKWQGILTLSILMTIVVLFGSMKIAGNSTDMSYDGRGYHTTTVQKLNTGWNPVKERLDNSATPGEMWWKWINVYPKGVEIVETVLYKATGDFEEAKGLNLAMSFMSWGFCLTFLWKIKRLQRAWAVVFSLIAVLNPVSVSQWLTLYNDGVLYSVILSLLSVLGLFCITLDSFWLILVGVLVALLWSVKMTGIVYGLVFVIFALAWLFVARKRIKIQLIGSVFIACLWGSVVWGYNPYVTSFLNYGNPLYFPVSEKEIVRNNIPSNLVDRTAFERLLISSFSRSSNVRGLGDDYKLKIPFTFEIKEVVAFGNPDVLVGGWGPLFGGVLIVSFVTLGLMIALNADKKIVNMVGILAGVVTVSCVLNRAASYARYVPQMWLVPVIIGVGAVMMKNKWIKCLGMILAGTTILNVVLVLIGI